MKFISHIPLKVWAWVMVFTNLVFAITAIIGAGTELFFNPHSEEQISLVMCIVMGFFNIFTGAVLTISIVSAKENYVLLYILLEMINLLIITIFAIINMFVHYFFPLLSLLILCLILWYGLYLMYKFYSETREYNNVQSGVIEISCNSRPNPMMRLPEKAVESTAV